MTPRESDIMTGIEGSAAAQAATQEDVRHSEPTSAETRIHWASEPSKMTDPSDLERQFEAMRSRNWITEKMVQQYQKHWHCGRQVALERLLAKVGK